MAGTFTQKRAREIGCFILALQARLCSPAPLSRLLLVFTFFFTGFFIGALTPSAVKAESLAVIKEESYSASLEMESPSRFRLSIVPALVTQRIEPQAFAVENPTRLVVDLPGAASKTAKNIPTRNALITALRTGLHADKSRLVLDIKSNVPPEFEVVAGKSPNAMDIVVTINGSGAGAGKQERPSENAVEAEDEPFVRPTPIQDSVKPEPTKSQPSPTPSATPSATPPPKASPTPKNPVITAPKEVTKPAPPPLEPPPSKTEDEEFSTLEQLEEEENKLIASKELEPEKIPPKTAVPGASSQVPSTGGKSAGAKLNAQVDSAPQTQCTLKGIYYQTTKSQSFSSIMFDVMGLQTYSLSQKDSAQYELRIDNARLIGEHLSLPQFPPDTFRGFEVILARQEGSNLVVQIHVEEGIKLQPYIAQEKLWIKVVE